MAAWRALPARDWLPRRPRGACAVNPPWSDRATEGQELPFRAALAPVRPWDRGNVTYGARQGPRCAPLTHLRFSAGSGSGWAMTPRPAFHAFSQLTRRPAQRQNAKISRKEPCRAFSLPPGRERWHARGIRNRGTDAIHGRCLFRRTSCSPGGGRGAGQVSQSFPSHCWFGGSRAKEVFFLSSRTPRQDAFLSTDRRMTAPSRAPTSSLSGLCGPRVLDGSAAGDGIRLDVTARRTSSHRRAAGLEADHCRLQSPGAGSFCHRLLRLASSPSQATQIAPGKTIKQPQQLLP